MPYGAACLQLIAQGCERPSEIAARLEVPQTALGRPLKRLLQLGLARRDIPFGKDAERNKKTLYKLSDPFLRFWYAFVQPRYSNPRFLSDGKDRKSVEHAFSVLLEETWEQLVRETLLARSVPGLDERWAKVGRWWGSGKDCRPMELDVVAESSDGKTLLVGEAKLSLSKSEALQVQSELVTKAAQLPFVWRYRCVETRLFVAVDPPPGAIGVDWCEEDI